LYSAGVLPILDYILVTPCIPLEDYKTLTLEE
jgi:hypothetical protein